MRAFSCRGSTSRSSSTTARSIRHRIAGREELVGSDVIVAHRLLKNHVVERLEIPAYALFSEPCVAAMAVDPVALGMTGYRDTYDDLGEVAGCVHDLGRGVDGGAGARGA